MATEAKILLTAVDQTKAAFVSVKQSLQGVHSSVTGLHAGLAGLAATVGGLALINSVRQNLEWADSLNKLSQRTGVQVERLSQLQFAAKLSDVSTESLTSALKKLNVSIAEGAAGDKAKVEAFRNLGVSLKDATGRIITADQALSQIANRFSRAEDGAIKTAYAVALMGKSGDELIPMLNGGGRALEEMMKKAERLGLTISTEFAAKAESFNDNLTIIESAGRKLSISLTEGLVNTVGRVAQAQADATEKSGQFAGVLAGLKEMWAQFTEGRDVSSVRAQLAAARVSLDAMSAAWASMSSHAKAASPDLAAALEQQIQKVLRLQVTLKQATDAYYHFSDKAGAGRGTAKDPRALGDVGTVKEQLKPLTGAGAGGAATEYDALIKRIKERIDLTGTELKAGRELTDVEKFQAKAVADLAAVRKGLTGAQREQFDSLMAIVKAGDLDMQVMRSQYEAATQLASARQSARNADNEAASQAVRDIQAEWAAGLSSVNERIKGLEDERDAITLAAGANVTLAEAVEMVAIARLRERRDRAVEGGEAWAAVDREITAREKLLGLVGSREAFDKQREMWESIDHTAHDVFTNIFEGGSDTFKRLGQTLKASLLDMLYQMTVKRWIINIAAQVSGNPGMASALGGTGGGGFGNIGSLLNTGSSLLGGEGMIGSALNGAGMLGGIGSSLFGSAGAYAAAVPGLTSTAIGSQAAMLAAQTGSFGAAGLSATASAGATATGAAGSFAASAASIIPVVGWVVAAAAVLYSIFGKKGGGPKQDGTFGMSALGLGQRSAKSDSVAQTAAEGLQQQYDQIIKAYGGQGGIQYGLGFSMDPKGTSPTFLDITGSRNGQTAFSELNRNVGRSQEELTAAIAEMGSKAILKGLQQSGLSDAIGDYLRQLGDIDGMTDGAISKALAKVQKAAGEKATLEEQIFQLTATATEQLTRARELERQAIDDTNHALLDRLEKLRAEKSAADALASAIGQANQQYIDFQSQLLDSGRGIKEYLDRLDSTDSGLGSPQNQLSAARTQFDQQILLASGGDRTALQAITQYADRLIQDQVAYSASGGSTRETLAHVKAQLAALPAVVSAEEYIAKAIRDASAAQVQAIGANTGVVAGEAHASRAVAYDVSNKIWDGLWGTAGLLATKFDIVDRDINGLIDFNEMKLALGPIATDDTIRALMGRVDTNGDGQLSRLEIINASVWGTAAQQIAAQQQTQQVIQAAAAITNQTTAQAVSALTFAMYAWVDGGGDSAGPGTDGSPGDSGGGVGDAASAGVGGGGFASGGAFTNSIIRRPTQFSHRGKNYEMGEAGEEGILPLANVGGVLGVHAAGTGGNRAVVQVLEKLVVMAERHLAVAAEGARGTIGGLAEVADNTAAVARNAALRASEARV